MIDRTGMRYGRLTVISLGEPTKSGQKRWLCKCDCGNFTNVYGSDLGKKTNSCGCLMRERMRVARNNFKHGKINTRIYRLWGGIKRRCYNKSVDSYEHYGGIGIKMCDEWKNDFNAFYEWAIANGYKDDLTIDRIDYNGNYEPSNCRWVTQLEQQNNKRNNHYITYNGETHTAAEWSRIVGGSCRHTILSRLKNGWSIEKALTTPVKKRRENNG